MARKESIMDVEPSSHAAVVIIIILLLHFQVLFIDPSLWTQFPKRRGDERFSLLENSTDFGHGRITTTQTGSVKSVKHSSRHLYVFSCYNISTSFCCILISLIAATGRKAQLAQNLITAASDAVHSPSLSVLSVDMGVRNLSLCRLHAQKLLAEVQVKDWIRLDIEKDYRPKVWPEEVSSFDPDRLAQISWNLVQNKFIESTKSLPDVVLIERQRFRSASSSSILEWTVRVNMLENMLHAVLYATAQQKRNNRSQILSINPKRVLLFWKQEIEQGRLIVPGISETNKERNTYKETKNLKIQIAKSILQRSHEFSFRESSFDARDQIYSGKGKNDDLADSFLQGQAWIQWQRNRRTLNQILEGESANDAKLDPQTILQRFDYPISTSKDISA